ncbi:MAG: hypothetical protein ACRDQA_22880 [Nocardioidaceae bacterium]
MASSSSKQTFLVLADAVTVTVGRKANGKARYTRVMFGQTITASPGNEQIEGLLRTKAVQAVDDADEARATATRRTPKQLLHAQGVPSDPAKSAGVKPLEAPIPITDPEALGAF